MSHQLFRVIDHTGKTHAVKAKDETHAKLQVVDAKSTYVPGGIPMSKWSKVKVEKFGDMGYLKESFMSTYRRNESQNRHAQNLVHLAKHYGSDDDKKEAQFYVDELKKHGHNKHHQASYALHQKLWPKAVEANKLEEKTLTPAETAKKEEIVKSMKKNKPGFIERYGKRAKEVMYATATKKAKELAEESDHRIGDHVELRNGKSGRIINKTKTHAIVQPTNSAMSHEVPLSHISRNYRLTEESDHRIGDHVELRNGKSGRIINKTKTHAIVQPTNSAMSHEVPLSHISRNYRLTEEEVIYEVHAPGTKVSFPHNGKMKTGKVVRHDKGDQHGSPFYVVDHGDYESAKVPAHKVQLAEELAEGKDHHVIASTVEKDDETGKPLYWHNRDGWVDRRSATKFTTKERNTFTHIPKDSKWEKHMKENVTLQIVKDVLNEVFTRKHFRQVADIIKNHPDPQKRKELASHHSEIFAKSNPRFDKKRFYQAAGVDHD